MTVARTARRRRKQHANGFAHLAPQQRPHYSRSAGGGSNNSKQQTKKK